MVDLRGLVVYLGNIQFIAAQDGPQPGTVFRIGDQVHGCMNLPVQIDVAIWLVALYLLLLGTVLIHGRTRSCGPQLELKEISNSKGARETYSSLLMKSQFFENLNSSYW